MFEIDQQPQIVAQLYQQVDEYNELCNYIEQRLQKDDSNFHHSKKMAELKYIKIEELLQLKIIRWKQF